MSQLRKEDIKQEVFDLYDDYAHNRIDRREFAQKLSTYAVGGITVAALMSARHYGDAGIDSARIQDCQPRTLRIRQRDDDERGFIRLGFLKNV